MTGEAWMLIGLIVVSAAMGFLLSCYAASKSFAKLRGAVTDLTDSLNKSTATMKLAMTEVERQSEEIRKLEKENDALRSASVTGKSPALGNRLAVAIAEWKGAIKPTPGSKNSRHVRRVSAFMALDVETRNKFVVEASRFLANEETDE